MAKNPSIAAQKRDIVGRKVKQLRRQGNIPANIFGSGVKSQSIQVKSVEFHKVFQEAGETSVIDLTLDGAGKTLPVMVHQIHQDPVSEIVLHVDFLQVDLTKKVTTHVPVEVVGESPAVKDQSGVLVVAVNEIEIEALPTDIPDQIQIDISKLAEFGDSVTASELSLSSKVSLVTDPETTIVTVQEPKEEELEPDETQAEVDVEESGSQESQEAESKSEDSQSAEDKSGEDN